jgi:hypothetical protein
LLLASPDGGTAQAMATNDASAPAVTYSKDVAPIMQRVCQDCHRPGTSAPFALLTYEDARRFAPLIKLRTQERQMPPWPLDKTVGIQRFKNDISLTDEEIATIGAWVDQGAVEGNPADAPPARVFPPEGEKVWNYAQRFGRPPDLVVVSPPVMVRANGMDQWPDPATTIQGIDKERWVRAVEMRPATNESRYVFHHANSSLMAAAVGKEGEIFPDDTGFLIKPGQRISFGMHLFPIGQDVEASLEIGVWLYPEDAPPKFKTGGQAQFRADQTTGSAVSIARRGDLVLPPHGKAMYQGYEVLERPARIHDLRGHMHMRGMYQVVQAIYPDGRRELINKLNWDPHWHTTFVYEDDARPLLPKGTVLVFTSVFDNSEANPTNPDPTQWVVAGSRSVDEMSHVWVGMTYFDNEADFQALVEERARRLAAQDAANN